MLSLLEHGFSIQDTLKILINRNNKNIFNYIDDCLKNGVDIHVIFLDILPINYKNYFNVFIKFLPLIECLKLIFSIENEKSILKKLYFKNIIYPFSMFIFTILGIYFFNIFCFPLLLAMLNEFKVKMIFLTVVYNIFNIFINIVFCISLFILVLVFLFLFDKTKVKMYKYFSKFKFFRIFKIFACNEFALFFKECCLVGCSTKTSMSILKEIKCFKIVAFLAETVDESLKKGMSINNAFSTKYFDYNLSRLLNVFININGTEKMLEGYLKINELKINSILKRISNFIKLFSYITISTILIFVYQILLLPLNIISKL